MGFLGWDFPCDFPDNYSNIRQAGKRCLLDHKGKSGMCPDLDCAVTGLDLDNCLTL